jgi:hypothetical protein
MDQERVMLEHKLVYLEIDSKAVLKDAFAEIRDEVNHATSRLELTDLYNRAGYLITLAYDSFWERKFFDDIEEIRHTAEEEFEQTARKINDQAEKIGFEGNYDEVWAD